MRQWLTNILFFWRKAPPPAVLFPEMDWQPPPPAPEPAPEQVAEPVKKFPICAGCNREYDPRVRARLKRRKLVKARQQAADIINEILQGLASLDLRGGHKIGAAYEARALEQLMGCDFYLFDTDFDHEALNPGDKFSCFNPDTPGMVKELSDVSWPIDQALVVHFEPNEKYEEPENYMLSRLRSIEPEEARGHAQYFVPKMARHTYAKVFMDGTWYTEDNYMGLINGKWALLDRGLRHKTYRGGVAIIYTPANTTGIRDDAHNAVSMALSIALTRRYSWHVALGNRADGPRILLATNPQGCLQFFKNRERDAGRSRRAALRHWVTRHYRDRAEAGLGYVRDHLRGNTEFRWSDLACEIFVSAYDLEKNEAFRREADLWRSQRKHNSVRVRLKRKSA
jgi:hypothetical protein